MMYNINGDDNEIYIQKGAKERNNSPYDKGKQAKNKRYKFVQQAIGFAYASNGKAQQRNKRNSGFVRTIYNRIGVEVHERRYGRNIDR